MTAEGVRQSLKTYDFLMFLVVTILFLIIVSIYLVGLVDFAVHLVLLNVFE